MRINPWARSQKVSRDLKPHLIICCLHQRTYSVNVLFSLILSSLSHVLLGEHMKWTVVATSSERTT